MDKRSVIHMLDPSQHTSPFDINFAVDAEFDVVIPYCNVQLDEVPALVQDAIFSRSPAGLKKTGIFIGGRDMGLAMGMLECAKDAMVPPFQVSVLADPSGAFTTAAALVACVERELKNRHGAGLEGSRAIVFGGTGPVGIATGVIASLAGADVSLVDHLSIDTALEAANSYNALCGSNMRGTYASSDADKARLVSNADLVFCTAKAGIQVLNASVLGDAKELKVAGDVNAVPPLGIEGLKRHDFGRELEYATASRGAVGVGALAVGDVKYNLQHVLLDALVEENDEPVFMDFRDAFARARELV